MPMQQWHLPFTLINFSSDGKGIAIGTTADTGKCIVDMDTWINKELTINKLNFPTSADTRVLMSIDGQTDWYKKQWVVNGSDDIEIRECIGDDVTSKFSWYGNNTKLMELQPKGSGTNITSGSLTVNSDINTNAYLCQWNVIK